MRPAGLTPYPRVEVGSVVVARDPAGLDLQVVRRPHEAFGPAFRANRASLACVLPQERQIAERAAANIARTVPLLTDDVAALEVSSLRYDAERLGGPAAEVDPSGGPGSPPDGPEAGSPAYSACVVVETVYAIVTLQATYREGTDLLSGRSLATLVTAVDAQGGDVVAMTEGTILVRLGALRLSTGWCELPSQVV